VEATQTVAGRSTFASIVATMFAKDGESFKERERERKERS